MVKIFDGMNNYKKKLHVKFQNFIYSLVEDHGWIWIDIVIDILCKLELNIKLAKNKEFLENLRYGDISSGPEEESWNMSQIPENDLYCYGCPFHTMSKTAEFFYGYQSSGYCYYLGNGDFSFGHPTDLLWDSCKCCGIKDDIDIEEFNEE
jgi:hypothetical protein